MKTKAEILESHIHPTKFLSSLSTETGKLAIFQAMDEHAQNIAQEFKDWCDENYRDVDVFYETSDLFAKFMAERGQG